MGMIAGKRGPATSGIRERKGLRVGVKTSFFFSLYQSLLVARPLFRSSPLNLEQAKRKHVFTLFVLKQILSF